MKIAIIQPDSLAAPGEVLPILEEKDIAYEIFNMELDMRVPDNIESLDAIIILGGVMGADDDKEFPFLTDIKEKIRLFDRHRKPVLGICLGAQLIASAFGEKVEKMKFTEFGIIELKKTEEAKNDPIFKILPDSFFFMEWHEDRFNLPEQAKLLATNDICPNQAFRIGDHIYGFQFHPEINEELLQNWIAVKGKLIKEYDSQFISTLSTDVLPALTVSTKLFHQLLSAWFELLKKDHTYI